MRTYSLLLAVSAIGMSSVCAAQEAGTPARDQAGEGQEQTDDGSLLSDEIVVTAQKKSAGERAQDVPIAITAISETQLDALNVRTLQDLNAVSPNVTLDGNSNIRGYANFAIRGAGVNSSVPTFEPAVGLFVDGVYQGISAGSVSDNFDLASVQILRGPQGTLFGRNVTGGAVLVETVRPSGEFGGYAEASLETGPEYSFRGAVEGPIIADLLSARLAGYYRKDEGWFTNQFSGSKFGELESFIVRPSVLLRTGALRQTLIFEYGDVSGESNPLQARNANNGPRPFLINVNEPGANEQSWHSVTSETIVDVDLGDGAITNVAGYRKFEQYALVDIDASPLNLLHVGTFTDQNQISNELRYAGRFGAVDVTVGLFGLRQELLYRESRNPFVGGARGGGGRQDHESYGVFGQTSIDITDRLNVIAGLRYSYEKKSATILALTPGRCLDARQTCDFNDRSTVDSNRSWDSLSPKLGLNFKASPDLLFYASFGKAVRSGGYNLRLSGVNDPGTFDQEDATAYEVGMKADLINRAVRVNVAAFRNNYKDLQRGVTVFSGPNIVQSIENSADARIQGVEAELTVRPIQGLEAIFGFGYLDAQYTELRGDLNGDRRIDSVDLNLKLNRVPKYSFSSGFVYNLRLGSGASLRSQAFYTYRSRQAAQDSNIAFFEPFNDLRADVTFTLPNRTTSLSVYGRNLTDEANNTSGITVLTAFPSGGNLGISEGRSLGVEIRQRF